MSIWDAFASSGNSAFRKNAGIVRVRVGQLAFVQPIAGPSVVIVEISNSPEDVSFSALAEDDFDVEVKGRSRRSTVVRRLNPRETHGGFTTRIVMESNTPTASEECKSSFARF
jgi:hypothetical protein